MNNIMDGKKVSLLRRKELIEKVAKLNKKLTLVDISIGHDERTKVYVNQKEKMAKKIGYDFLNLHYDHIEEKELISKIQELNKNDSITGIIVQLPLPDYLNKDNIINAINPLKDVDGLTDTNLLKLVKGETGLVPCTPLGIINLLDYYKIDYKNLNVVIVGRSKLVGYPLFNLLLKKNATVTLCHSHTKDLSDYTKQADLLIVAVGKKELIKKEMIKKNSVLVDVGINSHDGKLYGDIENCLDIPSLVTPVPGGVGPMTVITLMENVYLANELMCKKM